MSEQSAGDGVLKRIKGVAEKVPMPFRKDAETVQEPLTERRVKDLRAMQFVCTSHDDEIARSDHGLAIDLKFSKWRERMAGTPLGESIGKNGPMSQLYGLVSDDERSLDKAFPEIAASVKVVDLQRRLVMETGEIPDDNRGPLQVLNDCIEGYLEKKGISPKEKK